MCLVFFIAGCQDNQNGVKKEGVNLIKERCTACHSTDRIYKSRRSQDEWNQIIERMIRHGAELEPGDKEKIISFLTNR